jgi:hypothetical protein
VQSRRVKCADVKFLIDECLSFELVKLAHDRGYVESTHVVWRKLAGTKDWNLKPIILAGDWAFVTMNSNDFRGPSSNPGSRGQYADVAIHPGLICLNAHFVNRESVAKFWPPGARRSVPLSLRIFSRRAFPCGGDSRTLRRAFARRILDEFGERSQRGNIQLIFRALTRVVTTGLDADQCLWGAHTFGYMRDVEPVPVDLSMQMLTPLLVDAKSMHLLRRIGQKKLELAAILAAT